MFLATPLWLLALIPWGALAAWMLWGRRERVNVPFLALWRSGDARPTSSRAVQSPPIPVVLLLLAILFAIIAASSPTLVRAGARKVSILVDRGATMSASDGDSYRYAEALRAVRSQLGDAWSASVASVPATASPEALAPTAVDTSANIEQAAMRMLSAGDHTVVVITDRPVAVTDPRLVVVPPVPLNGNAGISHIAAREKAAAQVMVTVDAQPPSKQTVVITSDGQRTERAIDAPGTAFIDVPRLGKTVEVALAQGDALAADDRAWLVRESGWPRIQPIGTLPAELSRIIETYATLRPSRADARVVSVVTGAAEAAGDAVILAAPDAVAAGGTPAIVEHPVTSGVAWPAVLLDARIGRSVPAGFTPLVTAGGGVAIAVREQPERQVWVAIDSGTFARRADYVVFWTNVFDWLGRGGDAFVDHPIGILGNDWRRVTDGPGDAEPGLWPGVYERGDNTLRAVNARHVALPPPPADAVADWRRRLARRAAQGGGGGRSLAPYVLLAALACALGAAALWPGRSDA